MGLMNGQMRVLENRFESQIDFCFVDKNRRADILPQIQDVLIICVNFMSHSLLYQAKKKIRGTSTRLVLHYGGIDSVCGKIDEILAARTTSGRPGPSETGRK